MRHLGKPMALLKQVGIERDVFRIARRRHFRFGQKYQTTAR
jgi:hypothetical protein